MNKKSRFKTGYNKQGVDENLRNRIILYYRMTGATQKEMSAIFRVGKNTISKILTLDLKK